jgi:hypothetical protein
MGDLVIGLTKWQIFPHLTVIYGDNLKKICFKFKTTHCRLQQRGE